MIELLLQAERALSVGLLDRAETLYAQVASADPRNSIAVVGLARVALDRGNEDEALALGRRALVIDPENDAARRLVQRLEEVRAYRVDAARVPEAATAPAAATVPAAARPIEVPSPVEVPSEPAPTATPILPSEPTPAPSPLAAPAPEPVAEPAPAPASPTAPRSRSWLDRLLRRNP